MADHQESEQEEGSIGPVTLWCLVAGGMVGGGIYTALGVVVALAGQWAGLSFLLAGLIALPSAYNYCRLTNRFEKSGGAFQFLEEMDHEGLAGSLSWILLLGYVLTIALYAFAFGHYLAFAFHGGSTLTRVLALGVTAALIVLNLLGVGKMKSIEIVSVVGNLLVLLSLAAYGLAHFDQSALVSGIEPQPLWAALIGAASIFVSYEGFQLVTYEYDQLKKPGKNLTPMVVSGTIFVILTYIAVALGATSLAGALTIIEKKQVALSLAAFKAWGQPGLVALTAAAGMATLAAINSTLFSSANLAARIASDGELPALFEKRNGSDVPWAGVIILGTLAGILSVTGSLSVLVETASLAFLFTFGVVNLIAHRVLETRRWVSVVGLSLGGLIGVFLFLRLLLSATFALAGFIVLCILIFVGRPYILKRVKTDG